MPKVKKTGALAPQLPKSLRLKVEYRMVDDLQPYAGNARTHSDKQIAQIAASIRLFGFMNPVLIDTADGIIAGHGRVAAAQTLGLTDVPVIELAHLSEADANLHYESDGPADIHPASYRAIRHDRHPMGRWVDLVAPIAVRPDHATVTIPGHAPKPGAQTRSILSRLGYADADISAMIDQRTAAENWSERYLPE